VLGWSDRGAVLASDYCALLEHTRRVTFVGDGQAVLVGPEGGRLFDATTGRELVVFITPSVLKTDVAQAPPPAAPTR